MYFSMIVTVGIISMCGVVLVAHLCLTLCDPMGVLCSLPGSSVHGILQARILGWVVISFSQISISIILLIISSEWLQ